MKALQETETLTFTISKLFNHKLLTPISSYVNWKLDNEHWDDYNELYHVTKLILLLQKDPEVWFDTHNIVKNNTIVGVLLIVGGKVSKLENKYEIDNEEQSLLLKYFHLVEKGKGIGTHWIKNVIIPHYKNQGFNRIYVNSSHEKSFSFYQKFGKLVTTYEQISDNLIYKRNGECFKIDI
ncbi:hypothetical protein [Anditalea andensis]|uniref:N-acetyltransferase domain-containing protein n=1 Tax=Anditalea andensis TaxID=1048983 RepID=A0A074KPC7_9BACT|nr:hypothetical protein [Anditalea andensis]KEO71801.1 hypothetical protein EL17_21710 [Anditalea andensis]